MRWQVYRWGGKSGKLFGFSIGGPTDELHPFTKSSETGLGLTTDSTALPRDMRQISLCDNYRVKHLEYIGSCL